MRTFEIGESSPVTLNILTTAPVILSLNHSRPLTIGIHTLFEGMETGVRVLDDDGMGIVDDNGQRIIGD